eukprot:3818675-Prymnesium_polylepis.2
MSYKAIVASTLATARRDEPATQPTALMHERSVVVDRVTHPASARETSSSSSVALTRNEPWNTRDVTSAEWLIVPTRRPSATLYTLTW